MKREARDIRDRMPRPVRRIPLSEGPLRKRGVAFALALLAAGLALFFALRALTRVDRGWAWVEAESSGGPVSEVRLWAELGAGADSPLTERRFLTGVFSEASREVRALLSPYELTAGVTNLYWINHHPGEELQVDPRLYRALRQAAELGRWIFMGPVYEIWDGVYFSADDLEASRADPRRDADTAKALEELRGLLMREDQISLSFPGENRVRLNLSPELRALAEACGTDRYLDFGWMENAFAADLLAEAMTAAGWTRGLLVSPDGFARCLDDRGNFALEIRAEAQGKVMTLAQGAYQGPAAVAQLLPRPEGSRPRSYRYADGENRSPWISQADGLDRRPVDGLDLVARGGSCVQLLDLAAELLTADRFSPEALEARAEEGISLVAVSEGRIYSAGDPLDGIQ